MDAVRGPRRGGPGGRGLVLLALAVAMTSLQGSALAAAGPALATPPTRSSAPAVPLAPVPPLGHPPVAPDRPLAGSAYYTQIGATLSQINGSYSTSGLKVLSEEIPLVTSPYPVGYELNLLSDTGDWYQVLVGDNWPGCSSGFEEIIEIWNSHGVSGPVNCDSTLSLSKGQTVELNASLPGSSEGCVGLKDLSTGRSHVVCQSQPDTGASEFIFLAKSANGNGYYTGTMTEILNQTTTSCPDYHLIPTVTFDFPSWAHITQYVPWSDEWNAASSGPLCDSNDGPTVAVIGPSPESHYEDVTGGASDGPQEVEAQNDTLLDASVGFRFQSDPVPLTSETLNSTGTNFAPGGGALLQSSTSGGVTPYGSPLWEYDGAFSSGHTGTEWNFTTLLPGNYTFAVFGTDAQGDAYGSQTLEIRVPAPLRVGPITASTGAGADVGETVNFTSAISGGLTPLSYNWSGLPAGCPGANRSWVACAPSGPENDTIGLVVTDSNASSARASPLTFEVSPRLSVTVTSNRTVADEGQSVLFRATVTGGSALVSSTWSGLPSGCPSTVSSADCALPSTGDLLVSVSVTDSNHAVANAPPFTLPVETLPSVTISASRVLVDVGTPLDVNASVTGGAAPFRFSWTGLPTGCVVADLARIACTPSVSQEYTVGLLVTDRANGTAEAAPLDLEVAPDLSVILTPNVSNPVAPASLAVDPTVSGGSGGVRATWVNLPAGCTGSGLSGVTCRSLGAGNYTIVLRVADAGGGNATATFHFAVRPPSASSSAGSSSGLPWTEIAVGLAIVVTVIALAAVAAARRRRTPPPPAS
jgi:hypothetical protein